MPLARLKNMSLRLRVWGEKNAFYITPPQNAKQFPNKNHPRNPGMTTKTRWSWVQWSRKSLPYCMHQSQTGQKLHSYYRTQSREGCGVTPEGVAAETSRRHPCRPMCQALETLSNNSELSTRQGVLVARLSRVRGLPALYGDQHTIAVIVGWQRSNNAIKHFSALLASDSSSNEPTTDSTLFAKADLGIFLEMELAELRCGGGFVAEYPGAKNDTRDNENTHFSKIE